LNVNYAFNKEGLQGAEAAKSIGVNTAIDLITGGILEAVPLILKSGKKVASKADFDALSVPEKQEVVLRLTGPTEPQKLLSEGINWREPIRPDFYVNRGGVASPDVSAVQIAGELPAPPRSRIQRGPGARIKPKPTTAQAEGLFVDYYPERRAADVVRSNDFHPITLEAGFDPEELVTIIVVRQQTKKALITEIG
jgi:hypothetical protein